MPLPASEDRARSPTTTGISRLNINDFWPDHVPEFVPGESWRELLDLREKTFAGFMEREAVLEYGSLSSKVTQDHVRILMARCLEEYVEALDAETEPHVLEELIDSLNYLWSIALVDNRFYEWFRANTLHPLSILSAIHYGQPVRSDHLALVALSLLRVTDLFRNRSWMNNAQDTHFAGYDALYTALIAGTQLIVSQFTDWNEFYRYFVAKDAVLQFRLRSNY